MTVKATQEGQKQLGIAIYEIGQSRVRGNSQPVELVFDPSGAARLAHVTQDEADRRTNFWMNEKNPTFLTAQPPARAGEARFELEFSIDGNKRLLMTARDLKTHECTHGGFPVVKLT